MNELQSLSQIFQNKLFRIPDYQRGYAWKDLQLRDFWEDLINLQPNHYHYTGLLSLKALDRKEAKKLGADDQWLLESGFKPYHIVDGQQRLTTFVILLNELLEYVCGLPENAEKDEAEILLGFETVKDIRAKYICRKLPPMGLVTTFIFGYEDDNPSSEYLRYKVFGQKYGGTIIETYYTKNLKYAKQFFAIELGKMFEIQGMEGMARLYRKLTLQMMFNIHEIEDDYDVFVAFETMNNRGKKLTNLELLKNRLIYLTTLYEEKDLDEDNAAALRDQINRAWREVYYQLGRNTNGPLSDDDFLRAHWIMYFTYSRKKGDDYIKFLLRKFSHKSIFGDVLSLPEPEPEQHTEDEFDREETEDPDNTTLTEATDVPPGQFLKPKEIADYVHSLNETAQYWYYTFYPNECDELNETEKLWLDRLNRVGIGYFRPIVAVSLIPSVGASTEERTEFLKAVERFIFLNFRIAMYQSSYKSSDYNRKAREIYCHETTLREVTNNLNVVSDQNAQEVLKVFLSRMNQRFSSAGGFYSWYDLRYFLFEYEYTLAVKHKIEKLDWGILTKVVKDKITVEHILPQTPTNHYWQYHFRQFSPEEIKILSASLGNLLPLSQSINSSLQNDSFDDKKARGYVNGSHSEIEVSKEEEWDARHIYERGMKLLRFMEQRWNFHFVDKAQMEELLHIAFVNDGRTIPDDIPDEITSIEQKITGEDLSSLRIGYWTHALPIIRQSHDEGGPYSNVNPTNSSIKDGYFGTFGIHLFCGLNSKTRVCSAGLWIDALEKDKTKAIFDVLLEHRPEIDSKMSLPLTWDRKDDNIASAIVTSIKGDFTNPEEWGKISEFHAKMTKELADYAFLPYKEEIEALFEKTRKPYLPDKE